MTFQNFFAFHNGRMALDEKKRIGSAIATDSLAGYPEYGLLCIFPGRLLLKPTQCQFLAIVDHIPVIDLLDINMFLL